MIKKVLIANRGEIASRIIRTAKRMGIRTVAIFSDADRRAPHRLEADESYLVGPAPSAESYLNGSNVIAIAKQSGCDAIHPGYGFLSENTAFAKAVTDANIRFVGPSPQSIRLMGDKLAAKKLAKEQEIPLLPGTEDPISELSAAFKYAKEIGYPILLKAAGGGGGKGMRVVENESELESKFKLATSEAKQSFGDDRVFIEKYLVSPRHIEIQVMADTSGNVVHVYERDCSIQRRHQKVIEESPAPQMDDTLRNLMTDCALKLCQACKYVGAGTVEFLVDNNTFYFLEMNTRLQVEHPVTESISGIDLVEWQFRIANDETLPKTQSQISMRGHSIELRVYAENIMEGFIPSIGTLATYEEPTGAGIRVDSGVKANYEVPIYYDPMLSKLIVWGETRLQAISLMHAAISQYRITGIETTLPLGLFVMEHPSFIAGQYDTNFIAKHFSKDLWCQGNETRANVAALVAASLAQRDTKKIHPYGGSVIWSNSRIQE